MRRVGSTTTVRVNMRRGAVGGPHAIAGSLRATDVVLRDLYKLANADRASSLCLQ